MMRKIVQQGPTTLMVSLPIKWVRRYSLSKGGELDLKEEGNKLIVSSNKIVEGKKAELVIDSSDRVYIWRMIQPLYILGYDEIKIHFKEPKVLSVIQDLVTSSLIGFEIVGEENNSCIIKSVTFDKEENFSDILRRVFLNLIHMSELVKNVFVKRKDISIIFNLELMNNRHTMYLKRLLSKEIYPNKNKVIFAYMLVSLLENLANEYKFFSQYTQHNKNMKISKNFDKFYQKVDKQINDVYHLFYSYDVEKAKEIVIHDVKVEEGKFLFNKDPEVAYYFMKMIDLMKNISNQIIAINS